ncbi:MAG: lamin tail domain-containing protein, partial [Pseudomonadota bacterium]
MTPRVEGGRALGGTAVQLPAGRTVVKARIRDGNEWSALSEGSFLVGGVEADSTNVVISEIMYHPAGPTEAEATQGYSAGDFEYLEFLNIGDVPVDLTDLFFLRGLTFEFAAGALLQPGARGLIVSNAEAFALRYGDGLPVLGVFTGSLDDSGERLALVRSWDDGIQDLRYNDRGDWPEAADGSGRSLVLIDPDTNPDPSLAESWLASAATLGAPGLADSGTTVVSAYQSWKNRWEIEDDLADPDRDGLVNLLEYALDRLPLESDADNVLIIAG